jgi:membrane-bound ClpP family serine protease
MIKTIFLIIGIIIITIGFMPLFEYGSEWPELDEAPNVQFYPYVILLFFVIGGILIYIASKRKYVFKEEKPGNDL